MIPISYQSAPAWLIDDAPNWDHRVEADVALVAARTAGLSNRESRRGLSKVLRWKLRYETVRSDIRGTILRKALRDYKDEPVLMPLWPMAVPWSQRASAPVKGGLMIAWHRLGTAYQYQIYTTTEPGWPAADSWVAPCLVGRLEKRALTWPSGSTAELSIDFMETGPVDVATQVTPVFFTDGPAPSGSWSTVPKLCPHRADWRSMGVDVDFNVDRESVGFRRDELSQAYQVHPAEDWSAILPLRSAAVTGEWVEFLRQHVAGRPFWMPLQIAPVALTANVAAGATTLSVRASDVSVGDWLHFAFPGSSRSAEYAKVTAVGSGTITLDRALSGFAAATVSVGLMRLVRFARNNVRLTWRQNHICEATLKLRDLPDEYAPAAGETLGSSIGFGVARAWLYVFRQEVEGTLQVVGRYTSHEQDVTLSGDTYTSAHIDHGEVTRGTNLERDQTTLRTDLIAIPVLQRIATLRNDGPVSCEIIQVDLPETDPQGEFDESFADDFSNA